MLFDERCFYYCYCWHNVFIWLTWVLSGVVYACLMFGLIGLVALFGCLGWLCGGVCFLVVSCCNYCCIAV